MSRARIALPLVLTYWAVLIFGLILYTAARRDTGDTVAILWAGSVFGTLVGHLLGLTNVRLWFTAIVVGGLVLLGLAGPSSPDRNIFWMSFAPATLFAALSVGDRWSLASFWFPAMIWMLTILDNTHGKQTPDGTAAVTLGALALAFVVFLRVRETRRVALWRTVGTAPLAKPATSTIFKERAGKEIGRAGWMLATSAMVFAFTAWLAPQLWEVETFGADPMTQASNNGPAGAGGPPCCEDILEAERSRVKEYFDFGRGKDSLTGNGEEDCRKCSGDDEGGGDGGYYAGRINWQCTDADFELGYCVKCTPEDIETGLCVLCTDEQIDRDICVYGRWVGSGGGYGGGGGGGGGTGGAGGYGNGNGNGNGTGNGYGNGYSGNTNPTPAPAPHYEPPTQYEPPTYTPPTYTPPTYTPPVEPVPMPEPTPVPQPEPPQPEPQVVQPEPVPTPPAPAPEPSIERPAPSPSVDHAPKTDRPAPSANRTQKAAATNSTSELMRWLSAFIAAVIALQLLRYLLRPLRRAISLRHLRKPFWEETVDQRVSNYWQLVLVGLRDAGYRTSSDEQPREFARRTGVEGVDKCASILDRTRHGIRVDESDLDDMAKSAEVAYASARASTSTLARAAAQIRWPLA